MWDHLMIFLIIFQYCGFATCGYPPMGDEVQPGSVLLPASRRGRYLANIVRRQAVDGTGIKFNKDADRMNAEAKKKVDVLSEELLPYIIAEQERRTTLYKRVMTAIQNGEKGVTVAEIRNKPPAIIRKGLMYRCPTNRAPREPDGSGVIMCEDNIDPTPIMFESCLSAEDKELYVADNKYFFCNRHKIEGPDLPRNGTSVIGCAPCERTPLNYTSQKCALEDTDDVVVHYRYYPDRTYKFVSELDPDREVCEHWNPCQVGYIFSLPGPDQATPASELWHDYDTDEEISREEIVPPVPEDDKNETVYPAHSYTTSTRKVRVPDGYFFHGVGKYLPNGLRSRISTGSVVVSEAENIHIDLEYVGNYVKIALNFRPLRPSDATTYYARFEDQKPTARAGSNFVHIPLVTLTMGQTRLTPLVEEVLPSQRLNVTHIYFTCGRCVLRGVMIRATDGSVRNVDVDRYRLRKFNDEKGVEQSDLEIDFDMISPRDFGDYFLMLQNDDGSEERMKALTLKTVEYERLRLAADVGQHLDHSLQYGCEDCELSDVLCNGESVLAQGRIALIPTTKSININFVGFEDTNACVYMGVFKIGDSSLRKIVAILEIVTINVQRLQPPQEGAPFEHVVKYKCTGECSLDKVSVNGIPLETTTRRSSVGSVAYYLPGDGEVTIGITEYSEAYEGMFQGVFLADGEQVTKNLMEIGQETKENQGESTSTKHSELNANVDSNPVPVPLAEPEESGPELEKTEQETSENKQQKEEQKDPPQGDNPQTQGEENDPNTGSVDPNNPASGSDKDGDSNDPLSKDGDASGDDNNPDQSSDSRRRQQNATSVSRKGGKMEKPEKSCTVQSLRESVATGSAYNEAVRYACPGGELVAVSCRGRNLTTGLTISPNNSVIITFEHFEDANACVYMGVFKIGNTEHKKTLAVLEMVSVAASAVAPPPAAGELRHSVVYTCDVAKCDPEKIYINDKTLLSDDKHPLYSYKSQIVKGKDGKEVRTVTIDFAIKPFSREFEGLYQVVVSNGTERVTKNIMEIGSVD